MRRVTRGFTLIELIVVIAILALFVTTAIPDFSRFLARERRVSAVMSLIRSLNFARSEAITTNRYVAVCKSANGAQCDSGTGQWDGGWIVFVNEDRDSPPVIDTGETMLRRHGTLDDALTLTANRDGFNFRPRSIRSTAGSLFLCTSAGNEAIIVSYTGRVRTSPETADGTPVECD